MTLSQLAAALRKPRRFVIPTRHDLIHHGEHFAHMAYLGLVSVESHYWYGKVAAVGLCFALAALFIRDGHSVVEAAAHGM